MIVKLDEANQWVNNIIHIITDDGDDTNGSTIISQLHRWHIAIIRPESQMYFSVSYHFYN